jgi:hypothetical protein
LSDILTIIDVLLPFDISISFQKAKAAMRNRGLWLTLLESR